MSKMAESIITKSQCLAALPPEWHEDLLPAIQERVKASGRKVVVLDDDPTGTQTVHGIPVLTTWSVEALKAELDSDFPAFYILTNSRSLTSSAAQALSRKIGANLKKAAQQAGVKIAVVSRSDSTLRGHFPHEVRALVEALGTGDSPYLIIPFFSEGGRYTIDDVHYVAEGDQLIPAAQTSYAQDAAFGYRHSNLRRWVEEKTQGRIPLYRITSISLDDIRRGGPGRVTEMLSKLAPDSACVVNAASYRDLEVFVMGLLEAESFGHQFLYRTAASFVRVRAGIAPRDLLTRDELGTSGRHGGLFVVGSYVPKTTAQVTALLEQTAVASVQISVDCLLDDGRQAQEIERVTEAVNRILKGGGDAVIFTSRGLVKGPDAQSSLNIGRRVSNSLIKIVRGIAYQPHYLVAKGGITSSDVATKGLRVRRAMVMGQVLSGVPVWKLGEETRYPGMAYIVFPGNVGEADALVKILKRLARRYHQVQD
jgi:uncharacterized protein YgbK (DUF1537 family)